MQGRPRKITHDAEQGVDDFLDQNLTAYLDEVAEFLLSEYGIEAHMLGTSWVRISWPYSGPLRLSI